MWYRLILAYREIKDPKGETTIHKHKIPGGYHSPTFVMDEDNRDPTLNMGTGSKAFGPGHYTSQNRVVSYGYDYPYTRVEKLPMGTRILDYDNIDEFHGKKIQEALNKKYNLNLDFVFPVKIPDFLREVRVQRLYPVLVELGYDAIEYDAGRNFDLKDVLEDVKKDKRFIYPSYKDVDESELPSKPPKRLKRRINKLEKRLTEDKNILVINANILTNPKLFQKERFRPETLTEEEKQTLEKTKYSTAFDVTKKIIESYKAKNQDWQNEFLRRGFELSPLDALRLVKEGVMEDTFDPRLISSLDTLDADNAIKLIEEGMNAYTVLRLTKDDLDLEDFKKIQTALEKNYDPSAERVLQGKLDLSKIDNVVFAVENDYLDIPGAKYRLNRYSYRTYSTEDIEKLLGIGFPLNQIRDIARYFYFKPEDINKLLQMGFSKKELIEYFANTNLDTFTGNPINFASTGFTIDDILEEVDFNNYSLVTKIITRLEDSDFDLSPLWEEIKSSFGEDYFEKRDWSERTTDAALMVPIFQSENIPIKEVMNVFLKETEQPEFVANNISNKELNLPENADVKASLEKFLNIKYSLLALENQVYERNVLVCERCGMIFKTGSSYCKCGYQSNYSYINSNEKLIEAFEKYEDIVNISLNMPDMQFYTNHAIDILDAHAGALFDRILNFDFYWKDKLTENYGKFLNDERYLSLFTSLKMIQNYIENSESPAQTEYSYMDDDDDDDDGDISFGDYEDDED